jgi:hypothetical protein
MWSAYPGGDGPDEETLRRMSAPENEIPAAVPLNTLLARTDDVALALLGLRVYSTGVAFDLVVRMRPSAGRTADLNEIFWEHHGYGSQFLIGLEFADGRRVTSSRRPFPPPGDDGIVFHSGAGSGGAFSVEQSWWLSPLPPAGPLRVVVRCDPLGIPDTSTVLDGGLIARAAADVVELWPWERPPEPTPPGERSPEVPDDSWFAGPE